MSRSRGIIISDFGMLYRISRRNWMRWLKKTANNEHVSIYDVGAKCIGYVHYDISDWSEEHAKAAMEVENEAHAL